MTSSVKRSKFVSFMNTTPSGETPTYNLIGNGVTTGTINYSPQTTTETYIHEDTAHIEVESYQPTMPVQAVAKPGDAVFDFVDTLRKARAVLDDAKTDIVNVYLYEAPTGSAYPAEKQDVSIQIDNFGGDGGAKVTINYTLNYLGNAITGTFDPTTKKFTPSGS
jgi:hypothetical protein